MVDYVSLPTETLKTIRKQYREFLIKAPTFHSSRQPNFPWDVQRARDQIRMIDLVLNGRSSSRRRRKGPLKEFKF